MVIDRTETRNSDNSATGPRSLHYLFGAQQIGTASNNGTDNTNYTLAMRARVAAPGTGPFAGGAATGTAAYDFDQNYDAINGSSVGSAGGSYTAQGGETLAQVAQQLWGDASLWYLLADANGMGGSTELTAGQTITIPNKVINRHNTSDTFRPYDPNEAMGDTSPTSAAKPPKPKAGKCGQFGQILQQIVTLAVTITMSFTPLAPIAPIIGNLYGQAFGLATGIQTGGFNWKSLGMAVVMTAVSFGVGQVVGQGAMAGSQFVGDVVRGVASSAISQGIGVATHLQDKFDWAGVAAAGVTAGVGGAVSRGIGGVAAAHGAPSFGTQLVSGIAGAVAGAATRSIATGSDFGDNLIAALPDAIVQTVGRAIGNRIAGGGPQAQHDESDGRYDPDVHQLAQPAARSGAEGAPVANLSRMTPAQRRAAPSEGPVDTSNLRTVTITSDDAPITKIPTIDLDSINLPSDDDIIIHGSRGSVSGAKAVRYSARQTRAGLGFQAGDTKVENGITYLYRPSDRRWIPQTGTAPLDVFLRGLGTSPNAASGANSLAIAFKPENVVAALVARFQPTYQSVPGLGVIDPQATLGRGFDNFNTAYQLSSIAAVLTSMIDANPKMDLSGLIASRDLARDKVLQIDGGIALNASANPSLIEYGSKSYISLQAAYVDYSRDLRAIPQMSEEAPWMRAASQEAQIDRERNAQANANAGGLGLMPSDVVYTGMRGYNYSPSAANMVASTVGTQIDAQIGMFGSVAAPLGVRDGMSFAPPLTGYRPEISQVGAFNAPITNLTLYRGDGRDPSIIFEQAFKPRGTSTDLRAYVDRNEASAFVGTSSSIREAYSFASDNRGYVYHIDPKSLSGIDVNSAYPGNPYAYEREIVFPGGIPRSSIIGAQKALPGGKFGPIIPNPRYKGP